MKKLIKLFIGIILIIPFVVSASQFKVELINRHSAVDYAASPVVYDDGSFLNVFLTSKPENSSDYDCVVSKYDKDGNLLWKKTWGGTGYEYVYDMIIVPDNGFVITLVSSSIDIDGIVNNGGNDAVIVKFDDNGNVEWQKNWGGTKDDSLRYMVLSSDNYIYAVGSTESSELFESKSIGPTEALLFKFDLNGNIIWVRDWGGNKADTFYGVNLDENDKPIIVGNTLSTDIPGLIIDGATDAFVLKYDKDGNLLWQKRIGGDRVDMLYSYAYLNDSIIMTSYSTSTVVSGFTNKGKRDVLITNIDYDGNILWQILWGGNGYDYISDIKETSNGDYIMVGYTDSTDIEGLENKGNNDVFILKIDKGGNILWQKGFGGIDSEFSDNVYILPSDEFLVGGSYSSTELEDMPNSGSTDIMFLIYDKYGNLLWNKGIGSAESDSIIYMLPISDNEFFIQACVNSTDISNVTYELLFYKGTIVYDLNLNVQSNGTATLVQNAGKGIVTAKPDKGYEVDTIIIKNKNGEVLDLEIAKLEDGTYLFDLFTDVSVEVTFKEKIENPKTGILDMITILFIGAVISTCGFILVKRYNERYEI